MGADNGADLAFFSNLEVGWSGWKVQKHMSMYTADSQYKGSEFWSALCAVTYGPEEGTWVDVVPVAGADLAGVKLGELPGGTSWVNASGWLILFRDAGRHSAGVSWTRPICSSWENPLGVTEL